MMSIIGISGLLKFLSVPLRSVESPVPLTIRELSVRLLRAHTVKLLGQNQCQTKVKVNTASPHALSMLVQMLLHRKGFLQNRFTYLSSKCGKCSCSRSN